MKCDLCGSEKNVIIFDYARYEKVNILQCQQCDLVFLENLQSEHEIQEFYRDKYREIPTLPNQSPEEHYHSPTVLNDVQNRIKWIKNILNIKNLRILEIGSASGCMLNAMAEEHAEVHGIELTQSYVDYSLKKGLSIHDRPITELQFSNEFDLIVSFHCIEHIPKPKSTFRSIKKALKSGGCFMGEMPNQNDWRIQIFNNSTVKRFHYDPCHYFYYSPKTLKTYLDVIGFEVKKIETVERYDSLKQLSRILSGEYDSGEFENALNRDVFANSKNDVRLPQNYDTFSNNFNPILETGINSKLMGNCLRWLAKNP